jgi:hypothetical protein
MHCMYASSALARETIFSAKETCLILLQYDLLSTSRSGCSMKHSSEKVPRLELDYPSGRIVWDIAS